MPHPVPFTAADAAALLPHPAPDANKYTRGMLCVIGGSSDYPGAPVLASLAAARTGAGYVRLIAPTAAAETARTHLLSIPVTACTQTACGAFDPEVAGDVLSAAAKARALVVGPGLGNSSFPPEFLARLFSALADRAPALPMLLDADALNAMAANPALAEAHAALSAARATSRPATPAAAPVPPDTAARATSRPATPAAAPAPPDTATPAAPAPPDTATPAASPQPASSTAPDILTPHDGEASRLLGRPVSTEPSARLADALELAAIHASVVVLKGPDTLIASPDGSARIVTEGGPELAKAGSGDVLSGMAGALMAQGLPSADAAALAVFLHARSGKLAAARLTEISVMPEDIISSISEALLSLGE